MLHYMPGFRRNDNSEVFNRQFNNNTVMEAFKGLCKMNLTNSAQGKKLSFLGILLVLATLSSGCSPAIHNLKAPIEIPAQFSGSGSSPLPDRWCLSFKDTVLSKLIDQALANNFNLKTA